MWAFVLSYFAPLCLIAVSLEAYSLLKGDRGELILERGWEKLERVERGNCDQDILYESRIYV